VISQKNMDKVFYSNKHNYVEKANCWEITFIWKITKIVLEAFVSKSILFVYQNTKWNQRNPTPKIILNILKKRTFSCLKWPLVVWFHPVASVGGSLRLIITRSRSWKQSLKVTSKSYCCTLMPLFVPWFTFMYLSYKCHIEAIKTSVWYQCKHVIIFLAL
jgi:hypothetical protein